MLAPSINRLGSLLHGCQRDGLHLNGFRKNLTMNLEQTPSNHSYGYACSGICPTFWVKFPLNSVPFMKYAG